MEIERGSTWNRWDFVNTKKLLGAIATENTNVDLLDVMASPSAGLSSYNHHKTRGVNDNDCI